MHTPRKYNLEIFGKIAPGKTYKGKTSERGILLFLELRKMIFYSKIYQQ
jgi:hypothetical protein